MTVYNLPITNMILDKIIQSVKVLSNYNKEYQKKYKFFIFNIPDYENLFKDKNRKNKNI